MVSGKGRKQNSEKHNLFLKRFIAIFVFSTVSSIHFTSSVVRNVCLSLLHNVYLLYSRFIGCLSLEKCINNY
jgi:hypothetical protein